MCHKPEHWSTAPTPSSKGNLWYRWAGLTLWLFHMQLLQPSRCLQLQLNENTSHILNTYQLLERPADADIHDVKKFMEFLISHFIPNLTSFRILSKHIPACLPTSTPKLILWQTQGMKVEPRRNSVWSGLWKGFTSVYLLTATNQANHRSSLAEST